MKNLLLLGIIAFFCVACGGGNIVTVTVTNPLPMQRSAEMIELSMTELSDRLGLADTAQIVILDGEGEEVPYQITYDDKVIFPATVAANAVATYTLQVGTPTDVEVRTCGRCYPERLDDVAWENELVGFRAYGPGLQARGERGYGYDLFTKYNTTDPVLESFYAKELEHSISYHKDHGFGMDCYAVGPTLGAGVSALMVGDSIVYPWCYKTQEIVDNGPLRFTVKLEFGPLNVKGDSAVVETRIITLDAGSHLNKTAIVYSNLQEALPIVTGIVLHQSDASAAIVADAANGYITYVDPTTGSDNGKIFVGAAFPAVVKEAKAVYFSEQEKKQRNNADGHVLAFSSYEPGTSYEYYWGFAWKKAAIKSAEAWNEYMADFAQKVRNPLMVEVK